MRSTCAALCILLLAGCGGDGEQNAVLPDTAVIGADTMPVQAPPAPAVNPVIRSDGIGVARIGMRIGDLRRALQPGLRLGDIGEYGVDVMGIAVIQEQDTLYTVLMPAGVDVSDNTAIEMLATSNPAFRTAQGVGPGMTIAEAGSIYGQPTLSYNTSDESREYARFPALSPSFLVRVAPGSDLYAGFYDTSDEYNETTRYDPTATIWMIIVRR